MVRQYTDSAAYDAQGEQLAPPRRDACYSRRVQTLKVITRPVSYPLPPTAYSNPEHSIVNFRALEGLALMSRPRAFPLGENRDDVRVLRGKLFHRIHQIFQRLQIPQILPIRQSRNPVNPTDPELHGRCVPIASMMFRNVTAINAEPWLERGTG